MILDSLWVKLGFQPDPKGMEKFQALAQKAQSTMLGLGAAVAAAATSVGLFAHRGMLKIDTIADFADQMGLAAREVEALGDVARTNDSSLSAMQSGITTLTRMTGEAAAGFGRGAMFFKQWHINAKNADGSTKDFNAILGDVIDKMAGLDRTQRISLGQRLGFDLATINLMAKGRANFEALREAALKANPLAEEDYALASKTETVYQHARVAVDQLHKRLTVALMPTMIRVMDRFTAWIREKNNVKKLSNALDIVVRVLELLWKHLGKIGLLVGVFLTYKLGAWFSGWATTAMQAARSVRALVGAGGLLKTMLMGGLLVAIGLVIEDLWTFYRGGESVTGLLVKKWAPAIDAVKVALVTMGAVLVGLATGSGPIGVFVFAIGGVILGAQAIIDAWNPLKQWFTEFWDGMLDQLGEWQGAIKDTANVIPILGAAAHLLPDIGTNHGEERKRRLRESAFNAQAPYSSLGGPMREDYSEPWSMFPKGVSTQTTNIGQVNFTLPNVQGGVEAGRAAFRELTRLAHGGVGG